LWILILKVWVSIFLKYKIIFWKCEYWILKLWISISKLQILVLKMWILRFENVNYEYEIMIFNFKSVNIVCYNVYLNFNILNLFFNVYISKSKINLQHFIFACACIWLWHTLLNIWLKRCNKTVKHMMIIIALHWCTFS